MTASRAASTLCAGLALTDELDSPMFFYFIHHLPAGADKQYWRSSQALFTVNMFQYVSSAAVK
jgi:hypothetical protein